MLSSRDMTHSGQPANRRLLLAVMVLLVVTACCRRPPATEPAPPPPQPTAPVASTAAPTASAVPDPVPPPDPVEARAAELAAQAATWEPKVTPIVVGLAQKLKGDTYKLEFRLKTIGSISRKLRLRLSEDPTAQLGDVVIDDTLRYTLKFEDLESRHEIRWFIR